MLVGPTGGDVPAHLYRTLLVHENVYLWDNLWFAGQYPLVSYSLLYYPVAAVTGNVVLVVASVVAAAVLFERICAREWGAASVWPSRAFAVLAAGPLFTGTYSYAAGFATLLATVAALQSGRIWIAVGCGALTLGFSPLAFIFLVIVLAAVAVSRRRGHEPEGRALRRGDEHRRGRPARRRCGSSRPAGPTRFAASSSPRCSLLPGSA